MAYNEALADRVRKALAGRTGVTEKRMFGGLTFTLGDRMCCGVVTDDLMVRVGPEGYGAALAEPGARPMDFTGRPMKGMVYAASDGYRAEADLARWVGRGADFAASLPGGRRR